MSDLFFLDTAVFVYAAGEDPIYHAPCEAVVRAAGAMPGAFYTSAAVVQEILQVGLNRRRLPGALVVARSLLRSPIMVLPIEPDDCAEMASILEDGLLTGTHDALHLAVMRRHGLTHIITADRHFATVPGITAVDPVAAAAMLGG